MSFQSHPNALEYAPGLLWQALVDDQVLFSGLTETPRNSVWPERRHRTIRTAIGLPDEMEVAARPAAPRDPRFRADVLRAYERRCAICGYDGRLADSLLGLEAAHVRWRAYEGPDEVANGIAYAHSTTPPLTQARSACPTVSPSWCPQRSPGRRRSTNSFATSRRSPFGAPSLPSPGRNRDSWDGIAMRSSAIRLVTSRIGRRWMCPSRRIGGRADDRRRATDGSGSPGLAVLISRYLPAP